MLSSRNAKWTLTCLTIALAIAPAAAQPAPTIDSLKSEVESLKADKVAWREIAWKSCLLEGLKESRKPRGSPCCSGSSSTARPTTPAAECSPAPPVRRSSRTPSHQARQRRLRAGRPQGRPGQRPPDDEEGRLYREIGRSKTAPQGICVVNSAGKVLDWVLMFDDDKSVLAFLDHAYKRFAKFPDAKKPVAAERYMKFPSQKVPDVEDCGKALSHPRTPRERNALPRRATAAGRDLEARLFGRARQGWQAGGRHVAARELCRGSL